ncbi:MAG: hypothetical protein AMJ68_01520 [Acidithiobacillales bacterium SG8_45]|jgi:hypothetical protein|nr:MAG: hypothetical protein AMJ68_01520 [Acidithiobacillales bacterium SG8_45]
MKIVVVLLGMLAVLLVSTRVQAAPGSQAEFDALMDEFGVLTSYRAVASAEPLGILGFDVSLEGTSGTYEGSDVVLPKIKFQKGLIAGLDVAGYYSSFTVPGDNANTTAYGVALTYAIWDGSTIAPAWNVRGSYTSTDVSGIVKTTTTGIDTSMSKGLGPITPYVGIGMFTLNGTDATATYTGYSASKTRYYYGVSFDLLALNLTLEGDNTDGVNSYSAKIGFRIGD